MTKVVDVQNRSPKRSNSPDTQLVKSIIQEEDSYQKTTPAVSVVGPNDSKKRSTVVEHSAQLAYVFGSGLN